MNELLEKSKITEPLGGILAILFLTNALFMKLVWL